MVIHGYITHHGDCGYVITHCYLKKICDPISLPFILNESMLIMGPTGNYTP